MSDLAKRTKRVLRRWMEAPVAPSGDPQTLDADRLLRSLDRAVGARSVTGDRDALPRALGLALAGERVTAHLTPATLDVDVLTDALGLRAAMVIALVWDRARDDDATDFARVVDTSVPVLIPQDLQEVVDAMAVARRVAEERLVPVVVRLDSGLSHALQTVTLPTTETLHELLGAPGDRVHPATLDQEILFGRHRRRVPRWHDVEAPRRLAAPPGDAKHLRSRRLFVTAGMDEALRKAEERWSRLTGRSFTPVERRGGRSASLVLVATGSTAALARASLAALPSAERRRVAVLTARVLTPGLSSRIAEALRGDAHAVVLEPEGPTASGVLDRLVRLGLQRARENGRLGRRAVPDLPSLADREVPRVLRLPVAAEAHAGDLAAACRSLLADPEGNPSSVGARTPAETLPKRQARLDRLARTWPELEVPTGVGDVSDVPEVSSSISIAVAHEEPDGDVAERLARLLPELLGGHVRGRRGRREIEGRRTLDRVAWAPEPFDDPGPGVAPQILIWLPIDDSLPPSSLVGTIRPRGTLVLPSVGSGLPASLLETLRRRELELWSLEERTPVAPDRALGAAFGLVSNQGRETIVLRRLLGAARELDPEEDDDARAALAAGFESVRRVEVGSLRAHPDAPSPGPWLPHAATAAPGAGLLDDLPDLWDQVGLLSRRGEHAAVAPDARLATGAVPAGAARLSSLLERVAPPPGYDPASCTACGDCWIACPHGAIEARAVTPAALLGEGIRRAAQAGRSADALRPLVGKLAARLVHALGEGGALGPSLDAAFADLLATSPPPEPRRDAITEAFRAVRDALERLPAAVSDALFRGPEANAAGQGELLLLGIDPETCTGCDLCVTACSPGALRRTQGDANPDAATRAVVRDLAGLPSPTPESRERIDRTLGAPRGTLLGASARDTLVGSDGAEAGSGARLALRLALGVAAEARLAARGPLFTEMDELREGLSRAIHETLGRALPDRDLDALARGLEELGPETELTDLTSRIETAFEDDRVDVAGLRELVATARSLADLRARLEPTAAGERAVPLSLVVTGTSLTEWVGRFPWNPLGIATTVATVGAAAVASGLAEAHREETLERARLLRRARRAVEDVSSARRESDGTDFLAWADLTATERTLGPLLVVAADEVAFARELGPLASLLQTDHDVSLLILDEGGADEAPDMPTLVASLPEGRPCGSASVAFPRELAADLSTALAAGGPGLFRVHAPSPRRAGLAPNETIAEARRAVATGRTALFFRSPDGAFDLHVIPDPEALSASSRGWWTTLRALAGMEPAAAGDPGVSSEELVALEQRHAAQVAALRAELEAAHAEAGHETRLALARRLRARLLAAMERTPSPSSGPEVPPS